MTQHCQQCHNVAAAAALARVCAYSLTDCAEHRGDAGEEVGVIVEEREEHAADDRADQEADADARERARDLFVVHVQLLHQVLQARPVHAER